MITKMPYYLAERLPRQRHCGCLSLRFGCIFTALLVILYSILMLSQCVAEMAGNPPQGDNAALDWVYYIGIIGVLILSFVLSALMLVGVLKDMVSLIRPWIVMKSCQLAVASLLFIIGNATTIATAGYDPHSFIITAVGLLLILTKFYMLTVVVSYSRTLEERNEELERLKGVERDAWYTDL